MFLWVAVSSVLSRFVMSRQGGSHTTPVQARFQINAGGVGWIEVWQALLRWVALRSGELRRSAASSVWEWHGV